MLKLNQALDLVWDYARTLASLYQESAPKAPKVWHTPLTAQQRREIASWNKAVEQAKREKLAAKLKRRAERHSRVR